MNERLKSITQDGKKLADLTGKEREILKKLQENLTELLTITEEWKKIELPAKYAVQDNIPKNPENSTNNPQGNLKKQGFKRLVTK